MEIPAAVRRSILIMMLGLGPGIVHSTAQVRAENLRNHLEFLASDELAGRALGSPGIKAAGKYLAAELKSYGLQPAGDEGSFLQAITFERSVYDALPELTLGQAEGEDRTLVYGEQFRVYRPGAAGDFEVLVLTGESSLPEELSPTSLLCFPDLSRRKASKWLEEHGAPGALGSAGVITFLRRPGKPTQSPPRNGRFRLHTEGEPSAPNVLWLELSPDLRTGFLAGEVRSLWVDSHFRRERVVSHNVIGRLPAAENAQRPELAQQAVVVSAHYDHIGTLPAKPGASATDEVLDLIRNGADDDASGVALVLEIARELAKSGPQAREVLFLLATAEEVGILGTSYYLDHPSTALERTVANLNFEMVGRPDEKAGGAGRLWLSGAERTNLMAAYEANGLAIAADPYPEQNFFVRSDNIVFCYRGIVGQTLSSYNLHGDYHQVTDEIKQIDFEHMESCARAGLQAVRLVADGTIDPAWLPGGKPEGRGRAR